MEKVFIVTYTHPHEFIQLMGVYSTKEKAEAAFSSLVLGGYNRTDLDIHEMPFDENPSPEVTL